MTVMSGITLILIVFGPGVVLFVMERILIRVTRGWLRLLRFLPLLTALIPLLLAEEKRQSGGILWDLGATIYLVMAGVMLVGWGLAWIGAVGEHKGRD